MIVLRCHQRPRANTVLPEALIAQTGDGKANQILAATVALLLCLFLLFLFLFLFLFFFIDTGRRTVGEETVVVGV